MVARNSADNIYYGELIVKIIVNTTSLPKNLNDYYTEIEVSAKRIDFFLAIFVQENTSIGRRGGGTQ